MPLRPTRESNPPHAPVRVHAPVFMYVLRYVLTHVGGRATGMGYEGVRRGKCRLRALPVGHGRKCERASPTSAASRPAVSYMLLPAASRCPPPAHQCARAPSASLTPRPLHSSRLLHSSSCALPTPLPPSPSASRPPARPSPVPRPRSPVPRRPSPAATYSALHSFYPSLSLQFSSNSSSLSAGPLIKPTSLSPESDSIRTRVESSRVSR